MSVLVKGMEMPTAGRILITFPSGRTLEVSADNTQNILREAQAITIPPHGRLIDADALITKITDAAKKQPEIADVYYEQASAIGGWLYSMPTIIPAEEGET